MQGLTHLRWSLTNGRALSREVERRVKLDAGTMAAFVPSQQELTNFRWGGGGSVKEFKAAVATVCEEFLARAGRVVVFEHYLIEPTDDYRYLGAEVRVLEDGVSQVAPSGASRVELERLVDLWNGLPICTAFFSEVGDVAARRLWTAPERAPLDLAPIVDGLHMIVCGAYDQEGAVLWSAA